MRRNYLFFYAIFISGFSLGFTSQHEWLNWMGPTYNFITSENLPDLRKLNVSWKESLGFGYSGVVVTPNHVISMGHNGQTRESVSCFDPQSGNVIWKHSYPGNLFDKFHAGGPNATPLIHGEYVYTLSKDGLLFCLKVDSGKVVWKSYLPSIFKADAPHYGYASSPIIYKNQLLISSGDAVSFNPETGKVNWVTQTMDSASYGSVACFEYQGKDYALIVTRKSVKAISLDDGSFLSFFEMKSIKASCITPVKISGTKNEFYVATNTGISRIRFENDQFQKIWSTKELKNKLTNTILIDGYLYGINGEPSSRRKSLVCLDVKDGKVQWVQDDFEHGTLLGLSNGLCFLSDEGELIHIEADSSKYIEKSRKKVISGTCWTVPTLVKNQLFIRNDKGDIFCYNML